MLAIKIIPRTMCLIYCHSIVLIHTVNLAFFLIVHSSRRCLWRFEHLLRTPMGITLIQIVKKSSVIGCTQNSSKICKGLLCDDFDYCKRLLNNVALARFEPHFDVTTPICRWIYDFTTGQSSKDDLVKPHLLEWTCALLNNGCTCTSSWSTLYLSEPDKGFSKRQKPQLRTIAWRHYSSKVALAYTVLPIET